MFRNLNNNPLFRLLDKIPLLRRSGKATIGDLAKAIGITLALVFLLQLPLILAQPMMFVMTLVILVPLVGLILLAHPFLSHRKTFRETFGLKKRQ